MTALLPFNVTEKLFDLNFSILQFYLFSLFLLQVGEVRKQLEGYQFCPVQKGSLQGGLERLKSFQTSKDFEMSH